MTLRTALQQSKILTFVVMGAFVWLLLSLLNVMGTFDWAAINTGDFVGQTAVGGIAGVVVLAVLLGVLVVLYSEVSETSPGPEAWPPSER
ncbi:MULTISPECIES: hypothetical protein [Haloarcula]|uniref:Uncharacterized protein n=1 Tax=Haloarcula pellucida TaxID=1427151 RepID=A0A830GR02_9EURY|nr:MULTISPECIES: hypothetical protein [Halomicroarcula]MBX0350121.1 hypothetical protein [Halomicroarcula pellucida]MDS0277778.1 hypothetical protein [Halomicroarcula sp. S1AR25-4]QIO21898.1 hypothetical protein G9465_05855 [Haloarcula sp. JP-L23]GGO00512.1 hypothetical protein GCM10009030_33220 [Halomicroarcula pellucida]